jgi:transposase
VQQALRADPFAGDVFIFRPRRADRVKILVYDGHRPGPVQQEAGGRAVQLALAGGRRGALSAAQLATLLEGLPWHRLQPARSLARARPGERKCWLLGLRQ